MKYINWLFQEADPRLTEFTTKFGCVVSGFMFGFLFAVAGIKLNFVVIP